MERILNERTPCNICNIIMAKFESGVINNKDGFCHRQCKIKEEVKLLKDETIDALERGDVKLLPITFTSIRGS